MDAKRARHMTTNRKTNKAANRGGQAELKNQLADLLTLRAQGLLSQQEYEERLEEAERSLPEAGRLVEQDLPRGGCRFILREARSGRVLGEFDFHLGHEVDS